MKRTLKSFRQSTTMGLAGGLLLILGMILLVPEHIGAFFNIPGLFVVLGGTLAATLVSRPMKEVVRVLRQIPMLLEDHSSDVATEIQQLFDFAALYRLGKLRVAEGQLQAIKHPLLATGLRHIVDGGSRDELIKLIRYRMHIQRQRAESDVNIMRTMAVFAPAFGMMGTLFGLIHMMHGIGSSGISEIGTDMAFAVITTLYGIVAANLALKPLAMKLERRQQQESAANHMLCELLLMVQERRHPTLIMDAIRFLWTQPEDILFSGSDSSLATAA